MMTLAIVLGPVGAVLLLVSLVGGGFTFSGWVMPKVGKIARIPCFVIGGVLVLLAISLAVADSSLNPGEHTASGRDATWPMLTSEPVPGPEPKPIVFVGEVFSSTDAHEAPYLDAAVTSHLYEGDLVDIYCTVQGEAVINEETGYTSSLWNGTDAGFIPDVAVHTGTNQATMPPC